VDFTLSPTHRAVFEDGMTFARAALPALRRHDAARTPAVSLIRALAARGWLGLCLPSQFGGRGSDFLSLGLLSEALEYCDASLREVLAVHLGLHALSILQWGTPEQHQRWLPMLASGAALGAFALNEREAGSDVAAMRTHATQHEAGWRIHGEKTWITLATLADRLLVFARTGDAPGASGISAFVVDAHAPGIARTAIGNKLGDWAGDTGHITFDDVAVSDADRLGEIGEGFKIAMSALDTGRLVVAAGALGSMKACRDEVSAYAKQRVAFGKPIAGQQLVKQLLALMQQRIDCAELLVHKTAWLRDTGARITREASMAKWMAAEAAVATANDAVQILGSAGYADDYNAARHLRNCKASTIYQGTSQIHTLIQADYLLGIRTDVPLRRSLAASDSNP
jgi:glutaryl-CoA dehydrogenase (non-decarboxylating)